MLSSSLCILMCETYFLIWILILSSALVHFMACQVWTSYFSFGHVWFLNFDIIAAKNLVLAGVKSVTLHDEGTVELWDLSSNFYSQRLMLARIGHLLLYKTSRAQQCCYCLNFDHKTDKRKALWVSGSVFSSLQLSM